jgi:hypothetical protein
LKKANPQKYAGWPDRVKHLTTQQDAILDSMPGVMLNKIQHGTLGKGMGGFHGILRQKTKNLPPGFDFDDVLDALNDAYGDWSTYLEPEHQGLGNQLYLTAKKWLEEEAMRP